MIKRSALAYYRFFKDNGLSVLKTKDFGTENLGAEVDKGGCRCWILLPED